MNKYVTWHPVETTSIYLQVKNLIKEKILTNAAGSMRDTVTHGGHRDT